MDRQGGKVETLECKVHFWNTEKSPTVCYCRRTVMKEVPKVVPLTQFRCQQDIPKGALLSRAPFGASGR